MGISQIPLPSTGPSLNDITTAGNAAGWGSTEVSAGAVTSISNAVVSAGSTAGWKSAFNNSQVFTSSGTWTVPSGVTLASFFVRGGNGTNGAWSTTQSGSYPNFSYGAAATQGTAGGNSSVTFNSVALVTSTGGIAGTATGGLQVVHYTASQSIPIYSTTATGTNPGFEAAPYQIFRTVSAGQQYVIAVGSGLGAVVIVNWSA